MKTRTTRRAPRCPLDPRRTLGGHQVKPTLTAERDVRVRQHRIQRIEIEIVPALPEVAAGQVGDEPAVNVIPGRGHLRIPDHGLLVGPAHVDDFVGGMRRFCATFALNSGAHFHMWSGRSLIPVRRVTGTGWLVQAAGIEPASCPPVAPQRAWHNNCTELETVFQVLGGNVDART